MSQSDKAELEQLLEQAAAFARGEDWTGAVARLQWACDQFRRPDERRPHPDPAVEELLRVVEQRRHEYRRLLEAWQAENARRNVAYVRRELRASAQPPYF